MERQPQSEKVLLGQFDGWFDPETAARYLGVSVSTVRRNAAALGASRLGNRLRFRAETLDKRMAALALDPKGVLPVTSTSLRTRALRSTDNGSQDS